MITSSLTRLDGNFILVARTWWQLKSLSPAVLKTRFVHVLPLLTPSPPFFPSSSSFAFSRHRFDNLIIRYRYANNRRTRYFPFLSSPLARSREDREITWSPCFSSLPSSFGVSNLLGVFLVPFGYERDKIHPSATAESSRPVPQKNDHIRSGWLLLE